MQTYNLILASGSPRRRELLEQVGLSFTVAPADVDETLRPELSPREQVMELSRIKARAAAETAPPEAVILAADTIVVLDHAILGKPRDPEDARAMLRSLSGRGHQVLTGVTVRTGETEETACVCTEVHFRPLSEREIDAYVRSGEPLDKAGAYGIQGLAAVFVDKLAGDYYNVVGLPLCAAAGMLRRAGVPLLEALT